MAESKGFDSRAEALEWGKLREAEILSSPNHNPDVDVGRLSLQTAVDQYLERNNPAHAKAYLGFWCKQFGHNQLRAGYWCLIPKRCYSLQQA
ncbi:MAG: hypothetical protein AAFY29_01035 [Pseudomonadota bacterium]